MIEFMKDAVVGFVVVGLIGFSAIVFLSCLHATASPDTMDYFIGGTCLIAGVLILCLALA